MNSFSHYIVGRFLHRYIKREYGIKLGVVRFLYWNIMTDFKKPYSALSHKTDGWENHIRSFAEELRSRAKKGPHAGADISGRLGILCHFFADFFCRVHNADWEGTCRQHIAYEFRLYMFMRKSFAALCETDFSIDIRAGSISGQYEALRKSYLGKEPSFENDVVYTLRACLGAARVVASPSPA